MYHIRLFLLAIACFTMTVLAYNMFEQLTSSSSLKKYKIGELSAMVFHERPTPLPLVNVTLEDGSSMLTDKQEGKVRLINLWASWCGPCIVEMPALDRLQAKLGSEKFEVVAINVDRGGVSKAREYMDNLELKHLKLYADPTMTSAYTLADGKLPTSHVVDKEGKVVASYLGALEWDSPDAIALFEHLINQQP